MADKKSDASDGFLTMSGLLPRVLQKYGLKGELEESEVLHAWTEMATGLPGETSARRFRKGRLTVEVESSPLMMELVMVKEELRVKLNKQLGEERVEKVIFKIKRK